MDDFWSWKILHRLFAELKNPRKQVSDRCRTPYLRLVLREHSANPITAGDFHRFLPVDVNVRDGFRTKELVKLLYKQLGTSFTEAIWELKITHWFKDIWELLKRKRYRNICAIKKRISLKTILQVSGVNQTDIDEIKE